MTAHHHHGPEPGQAPPELSHKDEGPPGTNGQALKVQNAADSADCADQLQLDQHDAAASDTERLETLRERLARAGWTLATTPAGAHIVGRWGLARTLATLTEAEVFAQQVGAHTTAVTTPAERIAALQAVRDRHLGLAASVQRERLLDALQTCGSITTFEGSRHLDLYDPRARAMELRKRGHQILTTWRDTPTESGATHRIGVYSLLKGA